MDRVMPEPNSGCWLWIGDTQLSGYGAFTWNRKRKRAHRVAFELFREKIPGDLFVLHKCDTPCCVNPDHLFLGTHTDNMRDKHKKGRGNMPKGSKHHAAKITEEQAIYIYQSKLPTRELALRYGIRQVTVRGIRRGDRWSHATGGRP